MRWHFDKGRVAPDGRRLHIAIEGQFLFGYAACSAMACPSSVSCPIAPGRYWTGANSPMASLRAQVDLGGHERDRLPGKHHAVATQLA